MSKKKAAHTGRQMFLDVFCLLATNRPGAAEIESAAAETLADIAPHRRTHINYLPNLISLFGMAKL
jgi:hypothetical protein